MLWINCIKKKKKFHASYLAMEADKEQDSGSQPTHGNPPA